MAQNITRFRGDDYRQKVTLSSNSTPIPLLADSYSVKFSFKMDGKPTTTINGVDLTDNGEAYFPFPTDVEVGDYDYDVQLVAQGGEIKTAIVNKMTILDDVTKT